MLRPLMHGVAADIGAGLIAELDIVRRTLLTSPNLEKVMRMVDLDALRATVTAADGRTFTTTDGGKTWRNNM